MRGGGARGGVVGKGTGREGQGARAGAGPRSGAGAGGECSGKGQEEGQGHGAGAGGGPDARTPTAPVPPGRISAISTYAPPTPPGATETNINHGLVRSWRCTAQEASSRRACTPPERTPQTRRGHRPSLPSMQGPGARHMTSSLCGPPGGGAPKGGGRGGKAGSRVVARPCPSVRVLPSRPPSRPHPAAPAPPNPSLSSVLRGIKRDQGVAGPAGPFIAPGRDVTRNTRSARTHFRNFDVHAPNSTRSHRNRDGPRSGASTAVRAAGTAVPKGAHTLCHADPRYAPPQAIPGDRTDPHGPPHDVAVVWPTRRGCAEGRWTRGKGGQPCGCAAQPARPRHSVASAQPTPSSRPRTTQSLPVQRPSRY